MSMSMSKANARYTIDVTSITVPELPSQQEHTKDQESPLIQEECPH